MIHELTTKHFDYVSNEFNVEKDSLGISLYSKTNQKLSIHIGKHDIKFDNDISGRRMMIATERVEVKVSLLTHNGDNLEWFKPFIPTTAEQLNKLIQEFKFNKMFWNGGNVTQEQILNFLSNNLVD